MPTDIPRQKDTEHSQRQEEIDRHALEVNRQEKRTGDGAMQQEGASIEEEIKGRRRNEYAGGYGY